MSNQAIGTYLRLLFRDGTPSGNNFQNFAQGRTVPYEGTDYISAAFGFSGSSFDISGSSISASLLLGLNQLDLNVFQQAAAGRWIAEVKTVWLDNDTLAPEFDYTADIYEVLGISHDNVRLSVRLGSPLDAVQQNVPRLRLSQAQVGALPPTGSIPFS
jgi:hypothetical protein